MDEAQSLDPGLLQQIRLLTNLETSKSKLLHVILLGQPELDRILNERRFRPLKQRISVRYRLRPLRLGETKKYIQFRLKRAGSAKISIFDNGAVREIYRYSKGIPRLINIVCDNALISGFVLERKRIGKDIIRDVIGNLEGRQNGVRRGFWILFLMILVLMVAAFYHRELLEFFGAVPELIRNSGVMKWKPAWL